MIGSHNSYSYLPPKNLWGKITRPWGKCQDLTLKEQYAKGVRYFDIRLRVINNKWHLVHNRVDYGSCDSNNYISDLCSICKKGDVYLRFLLDERTKPDNAEEYTKSFITFVKSITYTVSHPNIIECRTFWDWTNHSEAINTDEKLEVIERHASVRAPWYKYILGTKHFAKKYNKDLYINYKTLKWYVLLIDYIEYGNE